MNTVARCPDCLDGPLPGAQWDYGHTTWKWRECETCKGTGRVHDLSGGVESRHAEWPSEEACQCTGHVRENPAKRLPESNAGSECFDPQEGMVDREDTSSGSSAPPAQNCGHVPDTEERKAQDRYEQAKHDEYMDRRLEQQEE